MMSNVEQSSLLDKDPTIKLGEAGQGLVQKLGAIGVVALLAAAGLGFKEGDSGKHFFHSYLVAYMWTLSIGVGALWWVTLQHLVNAKWSIVVRRIGELIAANMPLLAVLSLPIIAPAMLGNASLFPWVDHHFMESNHALHNKSRFLNPTFFLIRCVVYFGFWSLWSRYLLLNSRAQDTAKDKSFAEKARGLSAPSMIAIALTLTFAAIDLLMSLDPMWFSTIFGVYYFAGSVIAVHAVMVLGINWLKSKGRMTEVVTTEHFHDLGKMLFAFTVFWAYIGFSQFMLIWYANVPEETTFYLERSHGGWIVVSYGLAVVHFLFPFFGLLSRHVKRHRTGLMFWAVWLLVAHYGDMYWLIMPNYDSHRVPFGALDVLCWVGLASVFVAAVLHRAKNGNLVPTGDPRLASSLAFENG